MPLADALWHYEELSASDWATVDAAIEQRLRSGDELAGGHRKAENFGKLMERLLTFRKLNKVGACAATWRRGFLLGEGEHRSRCAFWPLLMPVAEALLEELKAKRLEFVSAGDGVRSLQALAAEAVAESVAEFEAVAPPAHRRRRAAVPASASLMRTAIDSARRRRNVLRSSRPTSSSSRARLQEREHQTPATAEEVLAVTEEVRGTTLAAALAHFAEKKQEVDLFTRRTRRTPRRRRLAAQLPHERGCFAATFERYRRDVHPSSRVLFVSFPQRRGGDGRGAHGPRYRRAAAALRPSPPRPLEVQRHARRGPPRRRRR